METRLKLIAEYREYGGFSFCRFLAVLFLLFKPKCVYRFVELWVDSNKWPNNAGRLFFFTLLPSLDLTVSYCCSFIHTIFHWLWCDGIGEQMNMDCPISSSTSSSSRFYYQTNYLKVKFVWLYFMCLWSACEHNERPLAPIIRFFSFVSLFQLCTIQTWNKRKTHTYIHTRVHIFQTSLFIHNKIQSSSSIVIIGIHIESTAVSVNSVFKPSSIVTHRNTCIRPKKHYYQCCFCWFFFFIFNNIISC